MYQAIEKTQNSATSQVTSGFVWDPFLQSLMDLDWPPGSVGRIVALGRRLRGFASFWRRDHQGSAQNQMPTVGTILALIFRG